VNTTVSGKEVPIYGTATDERFSYYKLELGPGTNPADKQWSYIGGGEKPVQNGLLWKMDVSVLPPGVYSVRVVVVDITGNYVDPPCQTVIVIR
jgi:hypothetical protein